jgi:hypothetical protein
MPDADGQVHIMEQHKCIYESTKRQVLSDTNHMGQLS